MGKTYINLTLHHYIHDAPRMELERGFEPGFGELVCWCSVVASRETEVCILILHHHAVCRMSHAACRQWVEARYAVGCSWLKHAERRGKQAWRMVWAVVPGVRA